MGKIDLSHLKNEINRSGSNKEKFILFKEGVKHRVRFLTDLEDGTEIVFHDNFNLKVSVPCQEMFGRECRYCENEDIRTRNQYMWSVYDYEAKKVRIIKEAVNNCSPVPALVSFYETYGTLLDRDYEIKQIGSGTNKTFSVVPLDKKRFRNESVKAMSEQAMMKALDKAWPDEEGDDDAEEIEEEETKKNRKKKNNPLKGAMNEPEDEEDDWNDEEEEEPDYSDMTPKELYVLCKKRNINCKPKKDKEYYVGLLEENDEEDDWDDED